MKQIINGKVYNTDTAELLHEWDNGIYGDFRSCEESLYKTSKGAYFISGSGGAMSSYARPAGNWSSGGSAIRPLPEDQAREWLETHEGAHVIEDHFKVEEA